jgi:large subunit ribosomal protein L18
MSNNNVTAQLIDDDNNNTIIYVTSVGTKFTGTMTEKAMKVGHEIATKSKKAKINQVVFDRGAKLYHGRVKALAIAAREEGLEF